MVEFNCEICGKFKRKPWSDSSPGTPRFCSLACKSEAQRRTKPVDREWLYQKYVVEKLDCTAIGKIVQRDPKRVWEWLQDYGIKTRKRGTTGNWKLSIGVPHILTPEGRKRVSDAARASRKLHPNLPHLTGGVHYLKGKRGAETNNWKGGITPERQSCYGSLEWKAAVRAVWKRDNAICQRCGKHHNTAKNRGTFDIHHIVGFECAALRCEVSNLVLVCEECHYWIHSKANKKGEFIKCQP